MKRKSNRVLLLGVALAVVLTSCAAPVEQTPEPQESESTTTTTTTTESTTTTTTAEDTTASKTTETTTTTTEVTTTSTTATVINLTATTAEPTTKKTAQSTVSKTEKPTTTEKTTVETAQSTVSKTEKPTTTEKTTDKATQSAATKTEKPTATEKTTVETTKSTTTTTTTTKAPSPYDPYEVKKPLPDKSKRCLVLNVKGKDLEMVFDRAMVYPQEDDRLMWHYTGTTQAGITYTCVIVAENETIYQIFCDTDSDSGFYSETDARLCIQQHLNTYQIPIDANNIDVTLSYSRAQVGANGETIIYTHGHGYVTLENKLGYFTYLIKLNDGMPFVHTFYAYSTTDEGAIPGYSGDDIPLLIPRWKSK